jgi:hypothetical protein
MITKVRPARPGLLRVCAHLEPRAAADLTGLRVLLVADLLLRAAELRRLQVLTVLTSDGQTADVERAADALGIHRPAERAGPGRCGPADVHLVSGDADVDGGLVLRVGAAGGRLGDDALAARLVLISAQCHEPADLTQTALADARDTVKRWRGLVAQWARSPSRPMPAAVAEQIKAAFGELDTPCVLALLRDLASDDSVPPGARFETFVYADRVLALELPREIGT